MRQQVVGPPPSYPPTRNLCHTIGIDVSRGSDTFSPWPRKFRDIELVKNAPVKISQTYLLQDGESATSKKATPTQ